jgi:predicted nuclease of predicted toxin-antitoxin system
MNILVDENIPRRTVQALRSAGHTVIDIRGTGNQGEDDDALWQRAIREQALLVTTDKAFTRKFREPHAGILVVCLRQPNSRRIHDRVMHAIRSHAESEWAGMLVVMRDTVQSVLRRDRT